MVWYGMVWYGMVWYGMVYQVWYIRYGMAGCDNSRTYVPEVRQYYGLVYFFVFSQVPRRYAKLLLSAYLLFVGTT